jgi:hypothetical protein
MNPLRTTCLAGLLATAACPDAKPAPPPAWVVLGEDGLFWSADLASWSPSATLPAGTSLVDGAHRDGFYVASDGRSLWTNHRLPETGPWAETQLPPTVWFGGLATSPSSFLAAYTTSVFGHTLESLDGLVWLDQDLPDCEIAHGNDWVGNAFLIGGRRRSVKRAARWLGTPTSGWNVAEIGTGTNPDPTLLTASAAGGGTVVSIGSNGSGPVAWGGSAPVPLGGLGSPSALAFGAGRWLLVGGDGTGGWLWWSDDGAASWSNGDPGTAHLHDVAFGDGTFVAVGAGATIVQSPDGLPGSWTAAPSPPGASGRLRRVLYVK